MWGRPIANSMACSISRGKKSNCGYFLKLILSRAFWDLVPWHICQFGSNKLIKIQNWKTNAALIFKRKIEFMWLIKGHPITYMLLSPSGELCEWETKKKVWWLFCLFCVHSCHLVVTRPVLGPWKGLYQRDIVQVGEGLRMPMRLESVLFGGQGFLANPSPPCDTLPACKKRDCPRVRLTFEGRAGSLSIHSWPCYTKYAKSRSILRANPIPNLRLVKILGILNNLLLVLDRLWSEFLYFYLSREFQYF